MSASSVQFRIADAPPQRLDKALARDVPEDAALSRTRLAALIAQGAVRINGEVALDAKSRTKAGDLIEIDLPPVTSPDRIDPEDLALQIVHEDEDLVVIDKVAGMVVHPAPGTPSGTLVNGLLHHFGGKLSGVGGERRPGIVHRIDKLTSGLLVVAKSDRAHHGLAAQFASHSVERRYLAVCHKIPEPSDPRLRGLRGVSFEGSVMKITSGLARHKTDRQRQAVVWDGQGRHAVTRVRVIAPLSGVAALVECRLETGRTHQIRVHMAHTGHGLIGDPVYGRARLPASFDVSFGRQALHAACLGFEHPVSGDMLRFESALPKDMADLIENLRGPSDMPG